jgi:hypothetical protein
MLKFLFPISILSTKYLDSLERFFSPRYLHIFFNTRDLIPIIKQQKSNIQVSRLRQKKENSFQINKIARKALDSQILQTPIPDVV